MCAGCGLRGGWAVMGRGALRVLPASCAGRRRCVFLGHHGGQHPDTGGVFDCPQHRCWHRQRCAHRAVPYHRARMGYGTLGRAVACGGSTALVGRACRGSPEARGGVARVQRSDNGGGVYARSLLGVFLTMTDCSIIDNTAALVRARPWPPRRRGAVPPLSLLRGCGPSAFARRVPASAVRDALLRAMRRQVV